MKLNLAEISTLLAALRLYQQQGMGDPINRPDDIQSIAEADGHCVSLDDQGIDELCEKINTGDWLDLNSSVILVAINTQQMGEQAFNVGSAIPPEGADPHNNYGLEDLWAEWQEVEVEEHPDSDSQFVEWLIEEKGWQRLGNVDSVVLDI